MNKSIPNEVAEYFKNGSKKLKNVWTKEPYILFAEYEDGIIKSSDLTDELTGVMKVLKNYDLFKTVIIDENGSIAWNTPNGSIDISKDNIYIYGKTVNYAKIN